MHHDYKNGVCECGVIKRTRATQMHYVLNGKYYRVAPMCTRSGEKEKKPVKQDVIDERDVLLISIYNEFIKSEKLESNSVKSNIAVMTKELLIRNGHKNRIQ